MNGQWRISTNLNYMINRFNRYFRIRDNRNKSGYIVLNLKTFFDLEAKGFKGFNKKYRFHLITWWIVMHKAAQAKNPLIIWQPIVCRKSWFKMPLCFASVVLSILSIVVVIIDIVVDANDCDEIVLNIVSPDVVIIV